MSENLNLPWTIGEGDDWRPPEHEIASVSGSAGIADAEGEIIGFTVTTGWNDKDSDRRAFILRACNAHDDLVAALKSVAEARMPGEARRIAHAALTKIGAL